MLHLLIIRLPWQQDGGRSRSTLSQKIRFSSSRRSPPTTYRLIWWDYHLPLSSLEVDSVVTKSFFSRVKSGVKFFQVDSIQKSLYSHKKNTCKSEFIWHIELFLKNLLLTTTFYERQRVNTAVGHALALDLQPRLFLKPWFGLRLRLQFHWQTAWMKPEPEPKPGFKKQPS